MSHSIRKWWILATGTLCLSLILLDQTIITVALKTIQLDLNASYSQLQWIVNAYLLSFTMSVMTTGKIADVIGHKRTSLIGIFIFTLSSTLCALSPSAQWLIASRALQGIGSALMYPPAPAIVNNAFPINERGKATGILSGVGGAFLSAGPFLGGLIITILNWPWIFIINIPLGILTFFVGLYSVPKDKITSKLSSIDWFGSVSLAIGIFLFIYTLMEGETKGWTSIETLLFGTLSIVIFIILYIYEKKHKDPLINLEFFKIPSFVGGLSSLFLGQLVIISTIFVALYFQGPLNFTPIEAGIALLPITLPLMIFGPINGYLSDHFGPRFSITLSQIIGIMSALWLAATLFTQNYWWLLPGYIMMGIYLSGVLSTSTLASINSVTSQKRSAAMGLLLSSRQLGSTLCIALMGLTIFETQTAYLADENQITTIEAKKIIKKNQIKQADNLPLTPLEQKNLTVQNKGFTIGYFSSIIVILILSIFVTLHSYNALKSYKPLE